MRDPIVIDVRDPSAPGEARRHVWPLADKAGFSDAEQGRAELVITELATNLVKHAGGGWLLLGVSDSSSETLEVLALDSGPGIEDVGKALRDGHSTAGTGGTGLGAISRQSDFFQVYSRPNKGTGILARIRGAGASQAGGVSVAFHGEPVNGDGWAFMDNEGKRTVMVVDGLGHGYYAHDAAVAARRAFLGAKGPAAAILRTIHDALRATRGAAVAVAELDPDAGQLRFAGVGNISATMIDPAARRSAVSMHGIAGHEMRDVREFNYPWSRESTLVMHSDGVGTRWDLDTYPALLTRDPVLIAGILWKDHRRPNDDSTVVVARTP